VSQLPIAAAQILLIKSVYANIQHQTTDKQILTPSNASHRLQKTEYQDLGCAMMAVLGCPPVSTQVTQPFPLNK